MFEKYLMAGSLGARFLWQLKKNQWKTLKKLRKQQLKKLKAIINFAYNYVPYYHRIFKSVNFHPLDLNRIEDLQKIPITTKMDVRNNYSDIFLKGFNKLKCIEYFTSGSTGIPLKTYKDLRAYSIDTALKAYAFLECGVRFTDRFVNIAFRQRSISLPNHILISYLNKTSKIIDILKKFNPDVIYTFPHILEDICSYDASGINPNLIFTQGEVLTRYCRSLIKNVFNLEINDTYGSVEFGRLAFECNEHSGLHMITDSSVIEFIDINGESVSPGERGEIVATGLYNYTMPIIRYRLGDIGIFTDEKCSCGRNWPLIKNIDGRISDIFFLPNGNKVYPYFLIQCIHSELRNNLFCISQYQIVQKKRNKIILKFVKGKKFDPNVLLRIQDNFKNFFNRLNEEIFIEIDFVEKISTNESGKIKTIITLID